MNSKKPSPLKSAVSLLIAATLFCLATASCSTVKGFGRDLQKLGGEIEEEVNEHHY